MPVSARSGHNIDRLVDRMRGFAHGLARSGADGLLARARHRTAFVTALAALDPRRYDAAARDAGGRSASGALRIGAADRQRRRRRCARRHLLALLHRQIGAGHPLALAPGAKTAQSALSSTRPRDEASLVSPALSSLTSTAADTAATMIPPMRRVARGTISRPPAVSASAGSAHLLVSPAEVAEHTGISSIAGELVRPCDCDCRSDQGIRGCHDMFSVAGWERAMRRIGSHATMFASRSRVSRETSGERQAT